MPVLFTAAALCALAAIVLPFVIPRAVAAVATRRPR
jgi:hypothetical protein